MFPTDIKVRILLRIRPVNRILFGTLTPEYNIARRRNEWAKVLKYCQEEINAPDINSVSDIKTKFQSWKKALAQKVKRTKTTGSEGGQDFSEAERLLHAILNENPCTKRSQVQTNSSVYSIYLLGIYQM